MARRCSVSRVAVPLYEKALATEQDERRQRRNLQDMRDWVMAGNPVDTRDSSMRSYDGVLAALPSLLGLLGDENPRVRTRTAYLRPGFPHWQALPFLSFSASPRTRTMSSRKPPHS